MIFETRPFVPMIFVYIFPSIALPFKKANLHSLQSEKSAFALVKYYVASVKCIASKSRSGNKHLDQFNGDLYEWLRISVSLLERFAANKKKSQLFDLEIS